MTILVVEPFSIEYEHANLNRGIVLQLAKQLGNVALCGTARHIEMLELSGHYGIQTIHATTARGKYLSKRRALTFFAGLCWSLLVRGNKYDHVLFLSSTPFMVFILKVAGWIIGKQIIVLLHGELEGLARKDKGIFSIRRALNFHNLCRLKYLVPGQHVLDALLQDIPSLKGQVSVFHIPVHQGPMSLMRHSSQKGQNVGYLGRFVKERDSKRVVSLARNLSTVTDIKFCCLGQYQEVEYVKDVDFGYFDRPPSSVPLTSSEYQQGLAALDAIVSVDPPERFRLGISGVFLDALSSGVPIFCLKNIAMDGLSNEVPGLIHQFDNETALSTALSEYLLQPKPDSKNSLWTHVRAFETWNNKSIEDIKWIF